VADGGLEKFRKAKEASYIERQRAEILALKGKS
jgi:hypothetical protein